jgi:hypothetical protein
MSIGILQAPLRALSRHDQDDDLRGEVLRAVIGGRRSRRHPSPALMVRSVAQRRVSNHGPTLRARQYRAKRDDRRPPQHRKRNTETELDP